MPHSLTAQAALISPVRYGFTEINAQVCCAVRAVGSAAMSDQIDAYVRLGMENRETIELARRHCLKMKFVESGGRGMLEAETGLPINMRQVRCPVALGDMAMNLHWIAADFVRENCGGCEKRQSTGEVPNLATVVAGEDVADEEARATENSKLEAAQEAHANRVDARKAAIATSDVTMAGAFDDLGKLDPQPGTGIDRDEQKVALGRLNALADKAPQTFTEAFVAHAAALILDCQTHSQILEPLRRLALSREEFGPATLNASLAVLRRRPSIPAGRCIADLGAHLQGKEVDDAVCRSAVMLAGAVPEHSAGAAKQTRDPGALRRLADLVPEQLTEVLNQMLRVNSTPSGLILPVPAPAPNPADAAQVAAAAGAARELAPTHQDIAALLIPALFRQLASQRESPFSEDEATPAIERTLGVFLALGVGDILERIRDTGKTYRGYVGDRCVRILSLAADVTFKYPVRRQPGDPALDDDQANELVDILFSEAAATIAGAWGDEARGSAAELAKNIAADRPDFAFQHLSTLLGAFLDLLQESKKPVHSPLQIISSTPPQLQVLEGISRDTQFGSAINRTLDAVERLAEAAPAEVCEALVDLINDERDSEREFDVACRLLKLLGEIGERHGAEPNVLQSLLPTLHTYIVVADSSLQVEAIDAWTSIAQIHPLPESLADLLPALTEDSRVGVARALARAAVRLNWTPEQAALLFVNSRRLLIGVEAVEYHEAVEDAARAAKRLARRLEANGLPERIEQIVLEVIDPISGYHLRDILDRTGEWTQTSTTSSRMARLRLRQAADPRINDRWNTGDDEELCDLLDTGAGLADLPAADLERAAVDLAPDQPIASAEFAEVAWRAARPSDAAHVLDSVLAVTPVHPSHTVHRQILDTIAAAIAVDTAVLTGRDWDEAATHAIALANALADRHDPDFSTRFAASINASSAVRRAFSTAGRITGADPAAQLEAQAVAIDDAGAALDAASQRATATGSYLRHVAGSCKVAAHLVRSEGAALDADSSSRDAHTEAARRQAKLLCTDLSARFAREDPLARPLLARLEAVNELAPGAETAALLDTWATLLLPLPIVTGPRHRTARSTNSPADAKTGTPVAVVLASVDGQLVTGPQVLRNDRVYDLAMRVQTDEWPEWAETLDLELLNCLTPKEITVPAFTWNKNEYAGDPETFEQNGSLALRFALAAGQPGIPVMTQLTWRGTREGQRVSQRIDVSGHRQLRVRPYDESRDRATDYPVFDERLLALYDSLTAAGYDEDQLQAFCRLFTAICRAGLTLTWEKAYRRGTYVTERTFHDELHKRLLADPKLGGRVDRGDPLALGFLDTRHDGITAELKVERKVPVTKDSAPKYLGQPTQYAAADGARLSILAILDMSPKTLPVGTPENYMFTLEPRHHGLTNPEAPSLTAVLIVNGNMPIPSSWSRRKTPVAEDPGMA